MPSVSVILPCYKQADQAVSSAVCIAEVLDQNVGGEWEILLVDDGGGGFEGFQPQDQRIRLLASEHNRGKGAALRLGLLEARGEARIVTDADLPFDPRLIPVVAGYLSEGTFHLVAGDRKLPESVYHETTGQLRRALSAAATFFIGTLVTGGVFDTQCGLKGIRGDVADLLIPLTQVDRFAFDVELMYLALRYNCSILRVPVTARATSSTSTVRPIKDAVQAVRDILRIKQRSMAGHYESDELRQLVHAPHEARLSRVASPPSALAGS